MALRVLMERRSRTAWCTAIFSRPARIIAPYATPSQPVVAPFPDSSPASRFRQPQCIHSFSALGARCCYSQNSHMGALRLARLRQPPHAIRPRYIAFGHLNEARTLETASLRKSAVVHPVAIHFPLQSVMAGLGNYAVDVSLIWSDRDRG